jgi:cysteine synthase
MVPRQKTGHAQFEEQYNTKINNTTAEAEIWSSFIDFRLVF